MIDILLVALFVWLFYHALRLTFKIAWGVAKVIAVLLVIIALPSLIGCLLFASGLILLAPVAIIAIAWGLLKACC